eukprot:1362481-Prymnesium_polylepis.1
MGNRDKLQHISNTTQPFCERRRKVCGQVGKSKSEKGNFQRSGLQFMFVRTARARVGPGPPFRSARLEPKPMEVEAQ